MAASASYHATSPSSLTKCFLSSSCPCISHFFTMSMASPDSPHKPMTPLMRTSFLSSAGFSVAIAAVSYLRTQRDRMPRLVHQHNFVFPSEGVEGPLHIKATALPDGNRIGACHRLHASSKEAANGICKLFPYYIKGAIVFIYRLFISRGLYTSTVSDFSLYPYNKSQTEV